MTTFYTCKNYHSFTNSKICPSCFSKYKFKFCKKCLNLVGVWETHNCQSRIEKVIEVEKIKLSFPESDGFVINEIKKLFGKNCKYQKISFLENDIYLVECGLKYYNVYSTGYGIDKIEQIIYHCSSYDEWKNEHEEFYFEMEGSNLYEFLKNRNSLFIYQTLRKVHIESLFEFVIGYPIFNDLKQDAERIINSNIKFVEYENDFKLNLSKLLSLFVIQSYKKDSLLKH